MPSRREFLGRLATAAVAAPFGGALPALSRAAARSASSGGAPRTPYPFVDGLSFIGDAADVAASGLSAFITDVSAVEQVKTTDGSIRYFRSFEACARSTTAARRALREGKTPGAFLATRGSEIPAAYRDGRTAVFFQLQGCEPIGDDLTRLDLFHELGVRVLQITHHNDNAWGGGAIERTWTGLTKVGFEGVERLNALRVIPDLSHASDLTGRDVLRASKRPVIVSHGAARALVNNARCTPDDVIRGVADSGGAVGIFMMSFWLTTDPTPTTEAYVRQIRHVANVGGIDAVAIANDYPVGGHAEARAAGNDNAKVIESYWPWWDGVAKQRVLGFERRPTHVVIPELNEPRRAFKIHDALGRAGFKAAEVEKIMGGNWTRVLTETLG